MENCIFCKIAGKSIPSSILFEDEEILIFRDIQPAAPFHALVIPKRHISTIYQCSQADSLLLGKMLYLGQKCAQENGLEQGARFVMNCLQDGGQTVDHIHLHVLGGKALGWPPG